MTAAGIAFLLFAATDLDDIFVLVGFFADPQFRVRQIVLGQYLGIALLVIASLMLSLVSLVMNPAYVGLLGLLPIAIGCKKAIEAWRGEDDDERAMRNRGLGKALTVATVTVANGGDNIGAYTPIFASSSPTGILIMVLVFAALTAVWIALSYWLVNHPTMGAPIRRFGHVITPVVLILIGVFVLHQAHSISMLIQRLAAIGPSALKAYGI